MTPRTFVLILAAVVGVAGFLLLLVPVTATMSDWSTVACGNGFAASTGSKSCAAALSSRGAWGWSLLCLGVVVWCSALLAGSMSRTSATPQTTVGSLTK